MPDEKTYTLFAGVNGAGKSTFYRDLSENTTDRPFGIRINSDEIVQAKFDHDWKNPNAQMAAGREAVKMVRECLNGDKSFNQETTLTGRTIITNIEKAKANGFNVNLFYVGLESAQLSMDRVAAREIKGGHGIPVEDLQRRYSASFENLKQVLPLCDTVQVFDNSGKGFDVNKPLMMVLDGELTIYDKNMPEYLKDVLGEYASSLRPTHALQHGNSKENNVVVDQITEKPLGGNHNSMEGYLRNISAMRDKDKSSNMGGDNKSINIGRNIKGKEDR